jgi:cell division protein FtsN
MEKDRKFLALISAAAVAIFIFSYAVGYFMGKQSGIEEERAKCEVEKKQIVKTLAKIAPVSRPQPEIEEKVIEGVPQESPPLEEEEKAVNDEEETGKNGSSPKELKEEDLILSGF